MTIKIEKISASIYKVTENEKFATPTYLHYDTEKMMVSSSRHFWESCSKPMSNDRWDILKLLCDTADLPPPTRGDAEPNTLPVVKRGVQADSVNVTLSNAAKGQYRIEWRNSESGKTRFIVHCFGCANSLQVARGIAFAQCAKVTHPMSKPTTDLSNHP